MKKLVRKNEFYIGLTIIALYIVIGSVNQAFFTVSNVFDLLRSGVEMGIFAVGAYIVIISGGIDVSPAAIGTFAMFTSTKILYMMDFQGSILLAYAIAAAIGIVLGSINGLLIAYAKMTPLIATLGTASMYNGFLLFFIGNREISNVPKSILNSSKFYLAEVFNENNFRSTLPGQLIVLVLVLVVTFFLLKYTKLGRGIFAMGGDATAASRVGYNTRGITMFIYIYVGIISALGGMVHTIMMANSNPVDLLGKEMMYIAAVVIGGTRITGGHGSLTGTMLGVLLLTIMSNSLILLGIPSYWQRLVTGLIIVVGTGITAYQALSASKRLNQTITE